MFCGVDSVLQHIGFKFTGTSDVPINTGDQCMNHSVFSYIPSSRGHKIIGQVNKNIVSPYLIFGYRSFVDTYCIYLPW